MKLFKRTHKKEITLPVGSGAVSINFGDAQDKLIAPFKNHPFVYSAIKTKSRNIAQVPFEIYKGNNDEPEKSGAVIELFNGDKDNPSVSFWEGVVTNLNHYGEAFLLLSDTTTVQGMPDSLSLLASHTIKPNVTNKVLTSWTYNGQVIPLDRIIHIKFYNPYDTIRGLAPLTPLLLDLETDYAAMLYNSVFFKNDGRPGNVFSTDTNLSEQAFKRLKSVLIDQRIGVKNAHKALLLDNGMKLTTTRTSNKDMEYLDGRKFTIEECCMCFGVTKESLQLYEDINYATSITANRSLWEKTLIPEMRLISETINVQFLNKYGYRGKFNTTGVTALSQPLVEMATAAKAYFSMGVPFDEINKRMNLGFPEFENSDRPYSGKDDFTDEPEPTKSKSYISKEEQLDAMRKAQWSKIVDKSKPFSAKMSKALRGYFRGINQKLMKRLTSGKSIKAVGDIDIDELTEGLTDDARLKAVIGDIEESAIVAGAKTVSDLAKTDIKQMLATRLTMVKQINETTDNVLKEALRQALEDSITAGLTEGETAKALIDAAEKANTHNLKRAKTIARTEVHGAFNNARNEAVKSLDPKFKRWIADTSGLTEDSHGTMGAPNRMYMHGEKRPFNEPYSNGLMYPLDPNGAASEVINCKCVEVYEFE